MTSPAPQVLQNWRKATKLDFRGSPSDTKEALGTIVAKAPDSDIKKVLHKIKSDTTHEVNNKAILTYEVMLLQDILKYLRGNYEGLTKEGVGFKILHRLYSLIPHNYETCIRTVSFSSESREVNCVGCGTTVCGKCNSGHHVICPECLK